MDEGKDTYSLLSHIWHFLNMLAMKVQAFVGIVDRFVWRRRRRRSSFKYAHRIESKSQDLIVKQQLEEYPATY